MSLTPGLKGLVVQVGSVGSRAQQLVTLNCLSVEGGEYLSALRIGEAAGPSGCVGGDERPMEVLGHEYNKKIKTSMSPFILLICNGDWSSLVFLTSSLRYCCLYSILKGSAPPSFMVCKLYIAAQLAG